jgi:hypothetical protein
LVKNIKNIARYKSTIDDILGSNEKMTEIASRVTD